MGRPGFRGRTDGRQDFIEKELDLLGGSRKAVEFLYDLKWSIIMTWVKGNAQALVDALITDHLHKATKNSSQYDDISEEIGTLVRRVRALDAAFRGTQIRNVHGRTTWWRMTDDGDDT